MGTEGGVLISSQNLPPHTVVLRRFEGSTNIACRSQPVASAYVTVNRLVSLFYYTRVEVHELNCRQGTVVRGGLIFT